MGVDPDLSTEAIASGKSIFKVTAGLVKTRYLVQDTDAGSGVLLAGGNYANPITEGAAGASNAVLSFGVLNDAVVSTELSDGDTVNVGERTLGNGGGAIWDVVLTSTVTPNTYDIVISTGDALLSLVLRPTIVNPHMFGVVDGSESTAALQAFLDYVANTDLETANFECDTITNAQVSLTGDGSTLRPKCMNWIGHMKLSPSVDLEPAIFFNNCLQVAWSGILEVEGGGAAFSGRTITNGVEFRTCARMYMSNIIVQGCKRIGVDFSDTDASNKNMMRIDKISATWCGSNPTASAFELNAAYTGSSDAGSSGSTSQRTTLTGMTVPPEVRVLDLVSISGYLYLVTAVTATTTEIYPWIDSTHAASGTAEFIIGAGVNAIGGDSGEVGISTLDVTGCGAGIRDAALYGSSVDVFVSQNCGVGIALGLATANSHLGGSFGYSYYEANTYDIVKISSDTQEGYINTSGTFNIDKCLTISAARLIDNTFNIGRKINGVTIGYNGNNVVSVNDEIGKVTSVSLSNESAERSHSETIANTMTFNLTHSDKYCELFGYNTVTATCLGTGGSNEPVGTLTFNPEGTWSIDGAALGASKVITGLTKPLVIKFVADMNNKNWRSIRLDGV